MVMETERSGMEWCQVLNLNSEKAVKSQLASGVDVNKRDRYGNTMLHEVIKSAPGISLARFLIHSGANVNIENNAGWTPLHVAVVHKDYEKARYLLNKGANVNATIREQEDDTPLHLAVLNDDGKMARLLLGYGASLDIYGEEGKPLEMAYRHKSYQVVAAIQEKLHRREVERLAKQAREPQRIVPRKRNFKYPHPSRSYV